MSIRAAWRPPGPCGVWRASQPRYRFWPGWLQAIGDRGGHSAPDVGKPGTHGAWVSLEFSLKVVDRTTGSQFG
jgi:hypothetical protein